MIRIVEDINNYQNKLVNCEDNIKKIYDMCTKEQKNAYELLELYGLTKRNFAITHSVIISLEEKINNYLKRAELQDFLINMAESSLNNKSPKYLVDNNDIFKINDDPYTLYILMSIIDEKLVDFENYSKTVDADLIYNTSKNISSISNDCLVKISEKVKTMEKADISNFEDDNFTYNFANYALLKAFKNQNIHECDYLPNDIRKEIITILQTSLKNFNTGNIYQLFDLAAQNLFEINGEAKRIEESNQERKLKIKHLD